MADERRAARFCESGHRYLSTLCFVYLYCRYRPVQDHEVRIKVVVESSVARVHTEEDIWKSAGMLFIPIPGMRIR